MLSSVSSSLLLSTALPPLNAAAGATDPLAGGQAVSGFAGLLKGLPTQAGSSSVSVGLPGGPAAVATDNKEPVVDSQTLVAAEHAPAQAAGAAKAETAAGKILPVALPEAAEMGREPELVAKDAPEGPDKSQSEEPAAAVVDPLLALPGLAIAPAFSAILAGELSSEAALVGAAAPPTIRAGKPLSVKTATATVTSPPRAPVTSEPKPQAADGQATDARSAVAVQISVATRPEASPVTPTASAPAELAAAIQPKPVRPAERPRVEASLPSHQSLYASLSPTQPNFASPIQAVQVASAPAQAPSPADINAALNRLVAAREALVPVEAALAIDHADFGEVSIRFEQSSDGRLSAELRAADPDLQRAVTAAVAADRGFSTGPEGDGGRSMGMANPRGSTAGGEAASGERGQPGHDRDLSQRRTPARPQAEPGAADPQAGVFA